MTTLDTLPAHQHTTFYLPAESQPFSSFSSGRFDAQKRQDAQHNSGFQSSTRGAPPSGSSMPGRQDPATAPQPNPSQLTSNLRKVPNAERGNREKAHEAQFRNVKSQPSDIPAPTRGPFPIEVSDLEDYQDPGSSSGFATPLSPSETSDFTDCQSEGTACSYVLSIFPWQLSNSVEL